LTYVITEACIGVKEGACVDVCPAACIHTTPDSPQNYIDPDVCIECEQCVLVCPVNAVFLDVEVPDEWKSYIEANAAFFRDTKVEKGPTGDQSARMIRAVRSFAAQTGMEVSTVVLDRAGRTVGTDRMEGSAASAVEQAAKKAYTALVYRVGTHQLRAGQPAAWLDVAVEQERVLMEGGGVPLVESGEVLGAIGVAGSGNPRQDLLCCQAALGSLVEAAH
jgi:ferredoxin